MKKLMLPITLCVLLVAGSAVAQEAAIDAGAEQLICDAGLVVDCSAEGECTTGSPESVDLPRFLVLNLAKEELSSPSPGFEGEVTPLGAVDRADGLIVVTGRGRGGRVFSLSIAEDTGVLRAAVVAPEFAFLVFGACVVLPGE